ncbi:MAG TPA: hypothetical protein VHD56_15285 [Tepidisphaeraceae bacterium]|nr:hypothetical protein [Tepidisphaeraceae bacterium]
MPDAEPGPTGQNLQVHLTFWQRPIVQDLLPFGTSILFHVGLIGLGLLTYGTYKVVTASVMREQLIIPEAAMIEGAQVGGIPNPGLGSDPNLSAAQNIDPMSNDADNWARKRNESLTSTLMQGGSAPDAADSVIGLGPRTGIAGLGSSGTGGGGDAGPLAAFGPPGGGMGMGPKSPFMGISGNAHRVIYICDASGSMLGVIPRVRQELQKAISVLRPIQSFNVIIFADEDVTALSRNALTMATPENKRKALDLSEKMYAAGATDPLPAIRMAFEQKPELIYILTDGFDQVVSFDSVINEIRKLNADKKVKVNTILVRSSGYPELEKVVRIIASENGGVCKIIDRQDM